MVVQDAWDTIELSPIEIKNNFKKNDKADAWDELDVEESWGKGLLRYLAQIPQGIAEMTGPGIAAGLQQFIGVGESLDPEEIEHIRKISEREGIPFDEEKYLEAVQAAGGTVPTVSNIAGSIESRTGIPLEAQTRGQKALRFASSAGKISSQAGKASAKAAGETVPAQMGIRGIKPGLPNPVIGAGVAGAKEIAQEAGIPEPLAELGSLGLIKQMPKGNSAIKFGPKTKPSGLTTRQYEKLQKPTTVAPSKIAQINEKIEDEVRQLTDKIVAESPVKETYKDLKSDIAFKQNSAEAFKEVEKLAENIPGKFSANEIKADLIKASNPADVKGISPSEFDKSRMKILRGISDDIEKKSLSATELVDQYRKNNRSLGEAFEPGQSFAYNRAKREAFLDYNKIVADRIEKQYPNSELSKLFKESNKRWTEISDIESIGEFLDQLFEGKIQYKKGKEFFDKQGMSVPFKRALGKDGYNKFETLMRDLMSTEQANKLLKNAKSSGYDELAKIAGSYIIHPKVAAATGGYKALKGGYNKIFEMLLDKPQMAVTWDRGINALKAGNYKAATQEFTKVQAAEKALEGKRVETLKKFNKKKFNPSKKEKSINK